MKIRGNRIEIVRGETFTLDKLVVNQDGSPYIVSSKLSNPKVRIVVSDSLYDDKNKKEYLLPIDLVFDETVPVDLKSILQSEGGDPQWESFPEGLKVDGDGVFISGYMESRGSVGFHPNDTVFYIEDSNGNKIYKYWKQNEGDKGGKWIDYEFPITCLFTSSDTKNFLSKYYRWSAKIIESKNDYNNCPVIINLCSDGEIFVNSI